ncbi:MAG: GAF domain-containing sensor histidine kinase [Tunicatimonas sp.]
MIKPELPDDESNRIEALYSYEVLDTPPEQEFDDLAKLASQICDTSISLITLVDINRQWFKAKVGVEARETPRDIAFCAHTILSDQALVVNDALQDDRFSSNPLVTSNPNIRFYAGLPLITPAGHRLGTLCVIDDKPKQITRDQLFALEVLSKQVVKQLELKLHNKKLSESFEHIQSQNVDLVRLNDINNRLISIISHDLSSPFTTMRGLIALLEDDEITKEELEYAVTSITLLVDTSSELIEQLLCWGQSRLEGDVVKVEPIRLDLMLQEKINKARSFTQSKGNVIVSTIASPYEILADPVLLKFIIRNLLHNANKFTKNGTIEVGASHHAHLHTITIEDNGCGMTPEKVEQLFDWNNRGSTLGTSGEKGTGIGLLICKEFVEKLRGTISVKSEVKVGTKFSFTVSRDWPRESNEKE